MSYSDLSGRTAVITGASRGIGAGLAQVFHAHGMQLALCARSPIQAPAAYIANFDVSEEAAVEDFAGNAEQELGHIDLWINNAGVLDPVGPVRDLPWSDFQRNIEVNLGGVFLGSRAFARLHRSRCAHLETPTDAVLINISSGAAWAGYAGWAAYCASKAGVDRLTEALQLEEADQGLRCYAMAPGIVDTAMQERIRSCSEEQFPMLAKFLELKQQNAFNTTSFVAEHILSYAFDTEARPEQVTVRIPAEPEASA